MLEGWNGALEQALEEAPAFAALVDASRVVRYANRYARRLAKVGPVGSGVEDAWPELVRAGGSLLERALCGRPSSFRAAVTPPGSHPRVLALRAAPAEDPGLLVLTGWIGPARARPIGHRQLEEALAVAAHELRGPLTTMRLLLELWTRTKGDPLGAQRIVEKIRRCTEHAGHLVDCLLRARTDAPPLRVEPVDLDGLCLTIVDTLQHVDTSHTLVAQPARAPVMVLGDRTRLEEVITNLVANAQRHTPAGTRVWVSVAILNGMAALTVEDDGPGLDEKLIPRLFRRFERGESGVRAGGLGLGLYLSAQIARAHGGRITAENRPTARGARFTVWLPVGPPRPAHAPDQTAHP